MSDPKDPKKKGKKEKNIPEGLEPDPETLERTDPQEKMKGPVSSTMQNIKEEAEEGDAETKQEADARKDRNM